MSQKIIIFNAPPQAGKDTWADCLTECLGIGRPLKFAKPLKNAAHALLGLDCQHDAFEQTKDVPHPSFHGMTPRQFYIWLSEEAVKPNHPLGKRFFGYSAANTIKETPNKLGTYVFSDGGFVQEVEVLMEALQDPEILLVHLHREGTSFVRDSRSYVQHPKADIMSLDNNGTLDDIPFLLQEYIYPWLGTTITSQALIQNLVK